MSKNFIQLWNEARDHVVGFLRSIIYSQNDRDDLLQNVACTAWQKKDDFDPEKGEFRNWILGIARIEVLNYLKIKKSEKVLFKQQMVETVERIHSEEASTVSCLYNEIDKQIDSLPSEQQKLLRMKYKKKMSISDMAKSLKLTEAAVKQRIYRIRNTLKSSILPSRNVE